MVLPWYFVFACNCIVIFRKIEAVSYDATSEPDTLFWPVRLCYAGSTRGLECGSREFISMVFMSQGIVSFLVGALLIVY